jgi:diacylglycerol kinase family enzyme
MIPAFINPAAGNAAEARAALDAVGGFDIREVPPETLADQVRAAMDEGARRLLVAGGDGSIGSAANVIAGTRAELAILPCGTLNHLAKDLSLPLALEDAARVALNGCVTSVNAAVVNDRLFLNTSSVGAYITFVRARERLEGRLGYHIASFVAATRLLFRMPTFRVTLRVEDEDVDRNYITPLVFIGVGERELRLPSLGARVPNGKSGLHVMVVRRRSGARALAAGLAAAARGVKAIARTPAVDAFLVESCSIESRTTRLSLDGELVSLTPPFEYRHVPAHLRVVVPDPKNAS